MKPKKLLLCYNPRSGGADKGLGQAIDVFLARGISLDIRPIRKAATLAELLRRPDDFDGVVLAGGDGTISSASGVVAGSKLPLGILPTGTANDFARTLGIPPDLEAAARIIAFGSLRQVDLGCLGERHFINVLSIGVSSRMAERIDPELKATLGTLSYAVQTMEELSEIQSFKAKITVDDRIVEGEWVQIAVGAGVHFGGGNKIAPDARPDDGLLHGYAIAEGTMIDLARVLLHLRSGEFDEVDCVEMFEGARILIETAVPEALNIDGETGPTTPVEITLLPRALTVFAPQV